MNAEIGVYGAGDVQLFGRGLAHADQVGGGDERDGAAARGPGAGPAGSQRVPGGAVGDVDGVVAGIKIHGAGAGQVGRRGGREIAEAQLGVLHINMGGEDQRLLQAGAEGRGRVHHQGAGHGVAGLEHLVGSDYAGQGGAVAVELIGVHLAGTVDAENIGSAGGNHQDLPGLARGAGDMKFVEGAAGAHAHALLPVDQDDLVGRGRPRGHAAGRERGPGGAVPEIDLLGHGIVNDGALAHAAGQGGEVAELQLGIGHHGVGGDQGRGAGGAEVGGVEGVGGGEQPGAGSQGSVAADLDLQVAAVGGEDRGRQRVHAAQGHAEDAVVGSDVLGLVPELGAGAGGVMHAEAYALDAGQRVAGRIHQAALVVYQQRRRRRERGQ